MSAANRIDQLNKGWSAWIGTKKKRWAPTRSNSYNIGHECDFYQYSERVHWQLKPEVDDGMQAIFEEGKIQEDSAIATLTELGKYAGFTVSARQVNVAEGTDNISARIDMFIVFDDDQTRKSYPVEFKTMNPNLFDQFNSLEDFAKSDKFYHRLYPPQVMSYLFHSRNEEGFVILKDKAAQRFKFIAVKLDWTIMDASQARADRIDMFIKNETAPKHLAKYEPLWCDDCWVRKAGKCQIVEPIRETKIIDSPSIEAALVELDAVAGPSKRADKLDKQVKEWIKGLDLTTDSQLEVTAHCGQFEIDVKDTGKKNKDGSKSLRISISKKDGAHEQVG